MVYFLNNKWQPKDYLMHYYSLDKLTPDEVLIFKYLYKFLSRFKKNYFKDFLDFGSGPTIHRLIPFINYAKHIYVADYLPENLQEIKFWLQNKSYAHDWDKQIEHILKIGYCDQRQKIFNLKTKTQSIKNILRKKIKTPIKCDAFKKKSLFKLTKKFDLVTSFYCTDSITSSKIQWEKAIKNLFTLVKPGGWVIISALRNTRHYMINQEYFPSPNISEEDFIRVFAQNGFDLKTIDAKIIPARLWTKSGIKSLIILSIQKNANRK